MFQNKGLICCFLIILGLFSGCNDYRKVLKSSDLEYKYQRAVQYYNDGDYYRALPLIEELHAIYRGTSKAELLSYYQAYCEFQLGDFILASHRFAQFTKTFPTSVFAEECQFMSAYCHYLNSPNASLDQSDTKRAIGEFQLFVNRYPQSGLVDSSNVLIDELRNKLEEKSVDQAELYYRTRNYKSAIIAIQNTLEDFPDTDYREELTWLNLRSAYLLAVNSVESKKEKRLKDAITAYRTFIDKFPQSKRVKEAETIYNNVVREQEKLAENQNL